MFYKCVYSSTLESNSIWACAVKNNDLPKSGGWGMGYLGKRSEGWSSGWSMVVSVGEGPGVYREIHPFRLGKSMDEQGEEPPQGLEFLRGP